MLTHTDYRNDDSEGLDCLSECGCDPPTGFELAGDSEQENGSGANVEGTVLVQMCMYYVVA